MRFMCLVFVDTEVGDGMSAEEWRQISEESMAFDKSLEGEGALIIAQALENPRTARTVRVRKGKALVTDGPFAETKEQVAGFILVEARDGEHALEIAARVPLARIGAVEVRPAMA